MVDPSFGGGSHLYDRSTRGGRATSATAATSATQQQRQHKINVIPSHLDLDRDPQPTRDRWGTEMPPKKEPCQTSSLGTFFDRFKQDKKPQMRKKEKQGVPPPRHLWAPWQSTRQRGGSRRQKSPNNCSARCPPSWRKGSAHATDVCGSSKLRAMTAIGWARTSLPSFASAAPPWITESQGWSRAPRRKRFGKT